MKILCIVSVLCGFFDFAHVARADLAAEMKAAMAVVGPGMADAKSYLVDGRLDEFNQKLLALFPEKSRSAAQAFLLGDYLFPVDPKTSYELHKLAAEKMPDEPQVQYEWAMEQHRAGEYAGAVNSYAIFSKANPQYAPAYGLCADCLLNMGKIKEAVAIWKQSEQAPQGTLEQLELLVCAVNSHVYSDRERAKLLAKAKAGDVQSAEQLIRLDCEFERDWWNSGPNQDYLKHDLEILRKINFAETERATGVLCAGDSELIKAQGKAALESLLSKNGFLMGDNAKLPQSGAMLSILVGNAVAAQVLSIEDARTKWGKVIIDRAKANSDADLFQLAGALYLKTDQVDDIDREAWKATGEARFALAQLLVKDRQGTLKPDDPLLAAAVKKNPKDALLAAAALQQTIKAGKPAQEALVNAIKAEYSHFSPGSHARGIDIPRPGADRLAKYFAMLEKSMDNR